MQIELTLEHKQNIAKARYELAKLIKEEGIEPSSELYTAANQLIQLTYFACEELPCE